MLMSMSTTCTIVKPYSNTVGSYLYTSDHKYRLEQQRIQLNTDHRFANCSVIK